MKLLKLEDVFLLQKLKFFYSLKNNELPSYFSKFEPVIISALHGYNTRSSNKAKYYKIQHEYAKHCIRYDIINIQNYMTPNDTEKVYTQSKKGYISNIKNDIISKYNSICKIPNCNICNFTNKY